jgi:hypothetical protein
MKMLMWFACIIKISIICVNRQNWLKKTFAQKNLNFSVLVDHIYLSWAEHEHHIYLYMGTTWSWLYGSRIYNYLCNQCLTLCTRIPLRRGVLDTTLCDKVCQWFTAGRWFFLGSPVSFTNKTDRHEIIEIMLKVELNTMNVKLNLNISYIDTNQLMSLIISPTYKWFFLTTTIDKSEWLLLNAKEQFIIARTSYISLRWYLLCNRPTWLSWIFIELVHWNNNTWINMLPHSDTYALSFFRANQSFL